MHTIKILIVEDDSLIAKDIKFLLEDWGYQVVGTAATAEDALEAFRQKAPDMALVDIQLRGETDGIEVVRLINETRPIPVVYLTAQADQPTADRARATHPGAYLLKPFNERHLLISLELALANFHQNAPIAGQATGQAIFAHEVKLTADVLLRHGEHIFIKQNYRFVKFHLDELVMVEADRNHSIIITTQHKYVVRQPLAAIHERLQHPTLVRVHRSFAVNTRFVDEFNETEMVVSGKTIALQSAYREDFFQHFDVL